MGASKVKAYRIVLLIQLATGSAVGVKKSPGGPLRAHDSAGLRV